MRRRARLAGLVAGASLLVGCRTAEVPPPPPAPPVIQTVGVLQDERIADPDRTYVLVDGRTIHIRTDVTRVLFEGGPGHPFVMGSDATGPFVAVFAHQDGLPDDCHIVPAGGGGFERGPFIEIKGLLWKKAAAFHADTAPPPVGQKWPGGPSFCFDERAEIATVIP